MLEHRKPQPSEDAPLAGLTHAEQLGASDDEIDSMTEVCEKYLPSYVPAKLCSCTTASAASCPCWCGF
jgi:hypothetical protein